jgi:cation transport ATPase
MLMDKTGTLTDGEFKIESIKFNESTFMLNHDELL